MTEGMAAGVPPPQGGAAANASALPRFFLWPARVLERHLNAIRYAYLLRFSILLWSILIVLPILDWAGISTSITRVMFALSGFGQFVAVGFYAALTGWIALLSARIVCAYGEERFGITPPTTIEVRGDMSWKTFRNAQIPSILFMAYTAIVSAREAGSAVSGNLFAKVLADFGQLLVGGAFAFGAWYIVTFVYSLLRTPPPRDANAPANGNAGFTDPTFHAFLLPRSKWLFLDYALNDRVESRTADWLAVRLGDAAEILGPGYQSPWRQNELHSGHVLAIILFVLLLAIYAIVGLFTWPAGNPRGLALLLVALAAILTVLVVSSKWRWAPDRLPLAALNLLSALVISCFFLILYKEVYSPWALGLSFIAFETVMILWVLGERRKKEGSYYRVVRLGAIATALLFYLALQGSPFPVLASILILLQSLFWLVAGVAFWADRFRIPLLTLLLVLLILFSPVYQDHFYATLSNRERIDSPTPLQVVQKYKDTHKGEPMIVVTASGGGIHSAAWTATVLNGLEKAFGAKGFHEHVVMMSSVSGGSIATSYWAELYLDQPVGLPPVTVFPSRVRAAECSSLEPAAWGVLYPDLNHLLIWKDLVLRPLVVYDRGWALQTAFARNLGHNCEWSSQGTLWSNGLPTLYNRYRLSTLRQATLTGAAPAFAFNTTLVNGGQRFLLSSYHVPPFHKSLCDEPKDRCPSACDSGLKIGDPACPEPPSPASDFLNSCPNLDLSLFTVARLSATFPYVSPVAIAKPPEHRAAASRDCFCYQQHIADGGYYDNDGMASAMEFLWSALGDQPPAQQPQIYLIEIRNSEEPVEGEARGAKKASLGHAVEQLTSPITTVLDAWDVAQPTRNQREYRLLESALGSRTKIQHFVFAFKADEDEENPLSWHLTGRDVEKIEAEWEQLYEPSAKQIASKFPSSGM